MGCSAGINSQVLQGRGVFSDNYAFRRSTVPLFGMFQPVFVSDRSSLLAVPAVQFGLPETSQGDGRHSRSPACTVGPR